MTDRTHPDSGRITGGIVEMLQDRVAELEAQLESIGAGGVSGPLVGRTGSKEREALRSIGEEQAFEAWFKVDCPVEGANAKIAAKAAWKARASLAASAIETKRYADGTTATGIGPLPRCASGLQAGGLPRVPSRWWI